MVVNFLQGNKHYLTWTRDSSHLELLNTSPKPYPIMIDAKLIDDLATKLSEAVPPGIKQAKTETEKHLKAILQSVLGKLDLVTRDEFDAQIRVLARTREKLEALEAQVSALENSVKENPPPEN